MTIPFPSINQGHSNMIPIEITDMVKSLGHYKEWRGSPRSCTDELKLWWYLKFDQDFTWNDCVYIKGPNPDLAYLMHTSTRWELSAGYPEDGKGNYYITVYEPRAVK